MNALPHCARECENGRVFSGTIDRKLMSVFGRDQEVALYTCVLKLRKSAYTGFQILFIRSAFLFSSESGLDFRKRKRN